MSIDIERIKSAIPIETLIGQTYTVVPSGNVLTTKEHDSLTIYPRTNSWAWFSKPKVDGKTVGGSTIKWVMHRDNCSYSKAIDTLSKMLGHNSTFAVKKHPQKATQVTEAWQSPKWQQERQIELEAAQERLWEPSNAKGEQGRAYLAERHIRPDVAIAFNLGVADVWNPRAKKKLPALLMPWMNRSITAIQYRFIGVTKDDRNADRFGQCKGGRRYLFGLQHCLEAAPAELSTLILVEGELNAISIFQSIYGMYPCDVVSFGPQGNITDPRVAGIAANVAKRYKRVILWADEEKIARAAILHMPIGTKPVKSPCGRDANALLCKNLLDDILFRLIREGQDG